MKLDNLMDAITEGIEIAMEEKTRVINTATLQGIASRNGVPENFDVKMTIVIEPNIFGKTLYPPEHSPMTSVVHELQTFERGQDV